MDGDGHKAPVDFSIDVLSIGAFYGRMTEHELFGARYGFAAVMPFFSMSASLDVPTPFGTLSRDARVFRQADAQLIPLILQWTPAPNWASTRNCRYRRRRATTTRTAWSPGP